MQRLAVHPNRRPGYRPGRRQALPSGSRVQRPARVLPVASRRSQRASSSMTRTSGRAGRTVARSLGTLVIGLVMIGLTLGSAFYCWRVTARHFPTGQEWDRRLISLTARLR